MDDKRSHLNLWGIWCHHFVMWISETHEFRSFGPGKEQHSQTKSNQIKFMYNAMACRFHEQHKFIETFSVICWWKRETERLCCALQYTVLDRHFFYIESLLFYSINQLQKKRMKMDRITWSGSAQIHIKHADENWEDKMWNQILHSIHVHTIAAYLNYAQRKINYDLNTPIIISSAQKPDKIMCHGTARYK